MKYRQSLPKEIIGRKKKKKTKVRLSSPKGRNYVQNKIYCSVVVVKNSEVELSF